jgi:Spy/CpxP family protein refolding chaperone
MVRQYRAVVAALIMCVGALAGNETCAQQEDTQSQGDEQSTDISRATFLVILNSTEGQEELKLTEDQKAKVREILTGLRLPRLPKMSKDAYRDLGQTKEYQDKVDTGAQVLHEMLTAQQTQRLGQLGLQMKGTRALLMRDVIQALGITNAQKKKLQDLYATYHKEVGTLLEQNQALSIDRNLPWQERNAKMAQISEQIRPFSTEWREAAMSVLTPQQRENFEQMKGAKFEMHFHTLSPQPAPRGS